MNAEDINENKEPENIIESSSDLKPNSVIEDLETSLIEDSLEEDTQEKPLNIEENNSNEIIEAQTIEVITEASLESSFEKESKGDNEVIIEDIEQEEDIHEEDVIEEEDDIDFDTYTRDELVEAIEKAVQVSAIEKIKRKIGLIKISFLKQTKEENENKLKEFLDIEGNKKEDYKPEIDTLNERFNAAFNIYRKNKKKQEEALEKEKLSNLENKKNILEQIKKLIESEEELKYTYDSFRKLQIEWKETGQVPHTETHELWRSYHFLVEKFLDKVRINEELRDLDRKKNLEQCLEICEKAEELLLNPSINESYKLLQQYHNEWKDIGALPADKKEEIWERFRQASIKVNDRRREYFESIKMKQQNNLAAKTVLCEKIEEIVKLNINASKKWQEETDKIIDIQNFWKTIGSVPPEYKEQIWKRFRDAINLFFDNKKEYFGSIKEEYLNNYNLKLDLCVQVESLKNSQDWKNATLDIIKLQNEWKKIGPLPKKQSDELWRRFRGACDYFFDKKQEYFANIDVKEKENLDAKLALIEKVKNEEITGDSKQVFDIIKSYQRQFTAIGHVPNNEKDKVQNLFRDAINAKLDALKINPIEKKVMGYKSKFETIKNDPRQHDIIKNEIRYIANKITQLNSDIQLWENNIGFFANSKSANILKQEFEIKIEKAKEEIKIMEEKLKFLKAK